MLFLSHKSAHNATACRTAGFEHINVRKLYAADGVNRNRNGVADIVQKIESARRNTLFAIGLKNMTRCDICCAEVCRLNRLVNAVA